MKKDYFEYHYDNVHSLIEESLQEGNSYEMTMKYLIESCEGLNLNELQEAIRFFQKSD